MPPPGTEAGAAATAGACCKGARTAPTGVGALGVVTGELPGLGTL